MVLQIWCMAYQRSLNKYCWEQLLHPSGWPWMPSKKRDPAENIFLGRSGDSHTARDQLFIVTAATLSLFNAKFCFKEVNTVIIKSSFICNSLFARKNFQKSLEIMFSNSYNCQDNLVGNSHEENSSQSRARVLCWPMICQAKMHFVLQNQSCCNWNKVCLA